MYQNIFNGGGAAGRRGFVARGVVLGDHRLGLARDAETEPARASFLARGRQQLRLSGVEHQSGKDLGAVGFFGGETDNDLAEDGVWEVADEVDAFFLVFFLRHRERRNAAHGLGFLGSQGKGWESAPRHCRFGPRPLASVVLPVIAKTEGGKKIER
uniref:DUF834 domain-containing protein n=1 Tax=Oryza nivara TaxID=4536 RepID=A0A0E0IEG6_ORYNI